MTYQITGLDPTPFRALFGSSEADLEALGIMRMTVTEKPGFPCRVTLEDREIGDSVLLLNHVSHDVANPYRASHAIFVTEGAEEAAEFIDEIPPVFRTRVLSLRGFDSKGMMADAMLTQPGEADVGIRKLFANPDIRHPCPQRHTRLLLRQDRKELTVATLARSAGAPRSNIVSNIARLDPETAWAAFMRRDRAWDGRVIGAVKTTGIYCKPSCPARRPKRANVEFFASADEARGAGYRACLRCKPDAVGRDREAVAHAVKLIERAEEPPTLTDVADAVGYAPHHFQRIFKRDLGVSPAEYARGVEKQARGGCPEGEWPGDGRNL